MSAWEILYTCIYYVILSYTCINNHLFLPNDVAIIKKDDQSISDVKHKPSISAHHGMSYYCKIQNTPYVDETWTTSINPLRHHTGRGEQPFLCFDTASLPSGRLRTRIQTLKHLRDVAAVMYSLSMATSSGYHSVMTVLMFNSLTSAFLMNACSL